MSDNNSLEMLERKQRFAEYKEDTDRVTAANHIRIEYFGDHEKIEGYYEDKDVGHLFGCDRLMKVENLYGRIQFGYNPNRKRSFIFSHLKTSLYDTVSSRYQKEMKEYQMRSLLKGQNQNKAFVSKRMGQAAVLFEKADTKPWNESTVAPYYGRVNTEVLRKTMPYLARAGQRKRLEEIKKERRELQESIRDNMLEANYEGNGVLRKKHMEGLQEENLVETLLVKKAAASKYFMRKINYAFDYQKHEMFEYYKNREDQKRAEAEAASTASEEDDSEE